MWRSTPFQIMHDGVLRDKQRLKEQRKIRAKQSSDQSNSKDLPPDQR